YTLAVFYKIFQLSLNIFFFHGIILHIIRKGMLSMSTGLMNIEAKEDLSPKQLSIVQMELEQKQKNVMVAYLLWFFLGWAGAHRFYTDRVGSGIVMLCVNICAFLSYIIGTALLSVFIGVLILPIAVILSLGYLIWWIIDAVQLQGIINNMNAEEEAKIIKRVR